MLSALLATKLHRPRPTSNLVARSRLTQRLDEGLRAGHPLVLVVAPAGYGKTTLVADWLDTAGLPSAWLSLDEADNDPLRFFAYVAAALRQALGPQLDQPLPEALPAMPQPPDAFVHPLINSLATLKRPVVLALDDYQVISAGPVQEAMALLLRRAPPDLHLVVLTRTDPPFPLARLRVREQMTEVRDRDLRFTPDEMTAFLNSLHRLNLPAEQITALESRTEGWAAGVQLAALSLQGLGPEQAARFISAFSGSHHYIVDYLGEEVLSRQPDAVREFLLQTSILDRMCAPLCDAIVGWGATEQGSAAGVPEAALPAPQHRDDLLRPRSAAQQTLEYLERSNLFVIPLDDQRHWYRYHHLFVDVLRHLLSSSMQPGEIALLHGRASDWYRQAGYADDAVHHALLAGHHERAAEIIEENAWSLVRRAELDTLVRWMRALPGDSVSAHPWLRIHYAWALLFRESEAAEAQLRAVEQQLPAEGISALPAEMAGHIAAIRAWIAYLNRDIDGAALLARQAHSAFPQMDAAVRSGLVGILGEECLARSDFPAAARTYAEAVELARSSGNAMLEVAARTSLGEVNELMGRLREAEAVFREALQRALDLKSPVAAQAYQCLASVHRERNDLASARHLADQAIETGRAWGVADTQAAGHLTLAAVLQAQGDASGANRALAEVDRLSREHPAEVRSISWIGSIRARLWLAQGKVRDAREWADAQGLNEAGECTLRNEMGHLTLVRILLAEHQPDRADRLLSRLRRSIESTGRHSNPEVLVLQALACAMRADVPSALGVLERALRPAQSEGYVRVFLDEGRPMETLLRTAVARWQDGDAHAYARRLLAAFEVEPAAPPTNASATPGLLSERELEVLRLIAAGRTNCEIADRLVIAIGTVKRHTANIFDRLDVSNRTEAVAKARQLGLL